MEIKTYLIAESKQHSTPDIVQHVREKFPRLYFLQLMTTEVFQYQYFWRLDDIPGGNPFQPMFPSNGPEFRQPWVVRRYALHSQTLPNRSKES
jgi:hypothetical protein